MIKCLSIFVSIIVVIFSGSYELEDVNKISDEEYKQNLIQEIELVENKKTASENIVLIEEKKIVEDNKSENVEKQENAKIVKKQELVNIPKQEPKELESVKDNNSKVQEKKVIQTEEKKEIQAQIIVERPKDEPKKDESQVKEITPDDLEYWCIAGGKHHIAGDKENEHGYYNSWDDAYNAFLNYTADWLSSQYKISECSCGLYYFWAIK